MKIAKFSGDPVIQGSQLVISFLKNLLFLDDLGSKDIIVHEASTSPKIRLALSYWASLVFLSLACETRSRGTV